MKKKVILFVIATVLVLALVACGQSNNEATVSTEAPTATIAPTEKVEPTATTVPTATSTPAPTATSTPAPTATSTPAPTATSTPAPTATSTPTPMPYAEEHGIVIENKTEYDVSFIHYLREMDSYEEAEYPGLTSENQACTLIIDSVTQKDADEQGYTTFTVQYHLDYAVKQSVDINVTDTSAPVYWVTPAFSICDYYTGLAGIEQLADENGIGETVLNWQGEEIKVRFSVQSGYSEEWGEWYQESDDIYSVLFLCRNEHTIVITVPDGYDGIMLCMGKKGLEGQGKAAADKVIQEQGKTGEILESGTPEDAYFVRLTDIAEVIDSEPAPTEVPEVIEPTPTEAPVAEAKSFPVEVTYMFDCGRYREERSLSWYDGVSYEPYLRTETFATFADFLSAPDPYDTMNSSTYKEDLCFNICNPRNNASFSYDDIKVLVEAIDPAYIELTEDKDLTPFAMGPSFEAELLASKYLSYRYVEEEKYEEVIVDGVDNSYTYTEYIQVNTKPVDYYVSTITERSTGKEFVWGVQFVLEDVDNPGTYYNQGYLYWDFYNTFISNPLEY